MKNFLVLLLISFFYINSFAQEDRVFEVNEISFAEGTDYVLFGNDVKLRELPSTSAAVKKILSINTKVTIVEIVTEKDKYNYNGINWFWYKVKANGDYGYIVGGLLAFYTLDYNNSQYVFSLKKEDNEYFLLTRLIESTNTYKEIQNKLITSSFNIKTSPNKGLEEISHMLIVSSFTEACGVIGEDFYIFNSKDSISKGLKTNYMGDGGIAWLSEDAIFPNDENGKKGKIIIRSEVGSVDEENGNFTEIKITSKEFEWKGEFISLENKNE